MASMCFQPVDLFTMKFLFDKYPGIGAFQLVAARSIISLLVLVIYLHKNLYHVTVRKLKGAPKGGLIFRCVQSALAMILKTVITRYLSITLISIVYNMIPMFVVIIAWCTLNEKIDVFEMGILLLCSAALCAIVWSGHQKNYDNIDWDEILMYVLLFV